MHQGILNDCRLPTTNHLGFQESLCHPNEFDKCIFKAPCVYVYIYIYTIFINSYVHMIFMYVYIYVYVHMAQLFQPIDQHKNLNSTWSLPIYWRRKIIIKLLLCATFPKTLSGAFLFSRPSGNLARTFPDPFLETLSTTFLGKP